MAATNKRSLNGHGGARPRAGRPRKDVVSSDASAFLRELRQLRGKLAPSAQEGEPCGFTALALRLLGELEELTAHHGEVAELIAGATAGDSRRQRELALMVATLPARIAMLKAIAEAATAISRAPQSWK